MLHTVKGIVKGRAQGNKFSAVFEDDSDLIVDVIYTSPMYRVNGGGLMALPVEGDIILAAYEESSGKYYYHSTIVDGERTDEIMLIPNFAPFSDGKAFDSEGRAVKVKYEDQSGTGLEIIRDFRPAPLSPITSVNLKSEKGKKVGLDDSPGVEAVVVQNQHGDGIILKGDSDKLFSSRSIRTSTYGSQLLESRGSSMDMHVVDGLDITIENRSSGAMGQTPSEEYWPNGKQPCRKWGGIYLRSDNGDVSIAANADTGDPEADGRIFITTPKARIQILEDGTIAIDSTTSIKLRTDGDLNMEGQNVNIKANGSLNMHSTSDTSISSDANVNADGDQIHLNSGNKINIATLGTHQDLDLNDYKE